jgi:hypothetical protein
MRRSDKMNNQEIHEMSNFEYTPQGFRELKTALKEGKIVRNPFARFYGEKVEVTVVQEAEMAYSRSAE